MAAGLAARRAAGIGSPQSSQSACVDKANFSEELGRKYAYEDAFEQLWELEGYAMRQRLFEAANG